MNIVYTLGAIFIMLALMDVNYGSFAVTCIRWLKPLKIVPGHPIKQPKMDSSEVFQCYVPCMHLFKVNESIGGSFALSIINLIGLIFMLINIFNKFVFAINSVVMLVCSILMFLGLFLYWLSYGIVTAYVAYTFGFGIFSIILCFLAPHLFCWYLKNNIPEKMRSVHKKQVFEEHSEDYIVKDRKG